MPGPAKPDETGFPACRRRLLSAIGRHNARRTWRLGMATISSPRIGSSGLDVKNIISQLVALERNPLDALKHEATTVTTKISAFGRLKSALATLDDSPRALASVTGWNSVSPAS